MIGKLISFVLLMPVLLFSQYNRPGSTDAQFLKIGISPRGTAMSDAYIAAVNGAEATYYNSAALPLIKGTDVVFNHTMWFAGINHEFFAVAHNFGELGAVGVSLTGLYTDEMKVRTPLQPEGTGETFYAGNYRAGLSYARYLTDRVTFGATVSYISMSLYSGFSANAFSIDIATLYVSDYRGFRFGMQIGNFGSDIQYVNESYPLPTNFTFGLAINAIDAETQKLLVSGSAVKPNEGEPMAQVGTEWNYQNTFFVRAGYRLNHTVATYSFGGGMQFGVGEYHLRADYSYSNYLLLGGAHRFGIGVFY
ncbi:MAG: PorV/PorQ family protein [Ignavibacteriales bacterium]|nr:PorV/PorQ family protein [Ignavibacteriales bacterium]